MILVILLEYHYTLEEMMFPSEMRLRQRTPARPILERGFSTTEYILYNHGYQLLHLE